MKILVVDDMHTMRNIIKNMLKDIGLNENDEAYDGVKALKMLRNKVYDLVITDLEMPNLNGHQLLQSIRNDNLLKDIPVIVVSCVDNREKIKSIIANKVNGFIIKPFSTNTLKNQIEKIKTVDDSEILVC